MFFDLYCWIFVVCCRGSATSVGEKELVFLLLFTCSFVISVSGRFLGTWDWLRFFIVALPGPSVNYVIPFVFATNIILIYNYGKLSPAPGTR